MECSVDTFEFLDMRKRQLLLALEEIRSTMTGDAASVHSLLSAEDGSYDAERARDLCDQLTELVDVAQKSSWALFGAYGPEVFEGADDERVHLARVADWFSQVDGIANLDDLDALTALDLRAAPTTLTAEERELVWALMWCALHVCSCAALGRTSVGSLRSVMQKTVRLMVGSGEAAGVGDKAFTHEDLLERELEHDTVWGLAWGQNQRRSAGDDLFDLMDAVYEVVTGASATTLEPEELLGTYRASERGSAFGAAYAENVELYDTLDHMAWGEESLRLLAGLDVASWRRLGPGADIDAVIAGLQTCSDEVLSDAVTLMTNDVTDVFSYMVGWDEVGDSWNDMSRASRIGVLRRDLMAIRDERTAEGEVEARVRGSLQDETRAFRAGIERWAAWVGDVDGLFERYRCVRACLRRGDALCDLPGEATCLPQGAGGVRLSLSGYEAPMDAEQLFERALDALLAERGLSFCADDQVFHRTSAYLDETRYQMMRLVEEG